MGSSRCREAFRADVFRETYQQTYGSDVRALNLCVSGAFPELYLTYSEYYLERGLHFKRIVLMVDDYILNGSPHFRSWMAETLQSYRDRLFLTKEPPKRKWKFFSIHHLLQASAGAHATTQQFEIPEDWQARYRDWESSVPTPVDWRFDSWSLRPEGIEAYRETLANLAQVTDELVVVTSPVTSALYSRTRSTTSIPRLRKMTEEYGIPFLELTRENSGLTNRDYYYSEGADRFNLDHMNPEAAIRFTEFLVNRLGRLVEN